MARVAKDLNRVKVMKITNTYMIHFKRKKINKTLAIAESRGKNSDTITKDEN